MKPKFRFILSCITLVLLLDILVLSIPYLTTNITCQVTCVKNISANGLSCTAKEQLIAAITNRSQIILRHLF